MTVSGRFWLPGPVELHPDTAAALARPMIGHRLPDGEALAASLQDRLRAVLGVRRPVALATCSATGLMEAAIRGGVRERVLCVVGGAFGERFARVAEACDKDVVRLHVAEGTALEAETLAAMLDGPPVDAVTLVHAETSTGVLAPIETLLRLLRPLPDTVIIVDAVTSIGATPVPIDAWGADLVLGAPQKALAGAPGVAFAVASDRFLERARAQHDRGLYLDLVALHAAGEARRFPQTPALPICQALDVQLGRVLAEGLAARHARHAAMRTMVEAWAEAHGIGILAPRGRRADAVTALRVPPGRSALALAADLRREGWVVGTGHGADADRLVRIGHMGENTPDQLTQLLARLAERMR
ncbi:MAG TPA: aminotransferase class V-fold PLP-dependent enzyme [Gemmatimonadales bacterium]|nr:aminotransferase class V-fold PLP-dependent enzyme [Gemmatimonadales bacterium]